VGQNIYDLLIGGPATERSLACLEIPDGQSLTYADVDEYSARIANLLVSSGIRAADRVVVQVEKSAQAVFLYLACLRAGAIFLPLNTSYTCEETSHFLADAQPRAMICQPERYEEMLELCRQASIPQVFTLGAPGEGDLLEACRAMPPSFSTVSASDSNIAAILYSSGTTGKPKGVMLTQGNLASNARTLVEAWGFTRYDILLHTLPIFHVHGLFVGLHCALLSRARLLFLPRFDAGQVCSLLPRATVFMGVPTYYTRLLALAQFDREICRKVRLLISGSAPLLTETFEQVRQRTGHCILERYGTTETLINTSNPLEGPRVPGSIGLPLPGIAVRIMGNNDLPLEPDKVGEIQVRGPNVFSGYWKKPEMSGTCFTADGFFRTGDLGRMDEKGYFSILGRSKDLIISGGFNIYPKEVEDCINRFEGVRESAVIGMPHPDFGEGVMAVVVACPGVSVDAAALKRFLRHKLANYKLPKWVVMTNELPRNTMGKVQKNRLREIYLPLWRTYLERTVGADAELQH
jgi:malonyl-CoA/methylmalonyl-CoA synthetase